MAGKSPKIDSVTGVEIREHEWDGIQELDTPTPRWWLWVFLACCIWAVGYWVVMPAWPLPSGYTKGVIGWSQRANVVRDLADLAETRKPLESQLMTADLSDIEKNPAIFEFAVASGRAAFKENCAPCHGSGAQGALGYPNLNDDDWLWGGSLSAIQQTITHGIRNQDKESRFSEMPAFLRDGILTRAQVDDVVEYVTQISGQKADAAVAKRGAEVFGQNCVSCHGSDGRGDRSVGAPNLTDAIWLYGGDRASIRQTVSYARNSSMPSWASRLSPATIRALAVYVHSLGGGEPEIAAVPGPKAP
ncbi:MAG: cytochrome-c oxidase, cbb3-type subunit III [Rhodospirillaceae bacterium]|nr:MAG: cytochrome-c oxidase, cbb3-type subunit III [Rhodospirillaceae bacterium]